MTNDERVLKMLAGAIFESGSALTLPSGRVLDADEAQVLTSYYAEDEG